MTVPQTLAQSGPVSNDQDDAPEALNAEEQAFAEEIARGATLRQASTTTGIPYRTCRRWRRRPEIQTMIRELAREAVQAGALTLGQSASIAATALRKIADGSDLAEGPRVSACRTILEIGLKVLEFDELAKRLEVVEAQLASQGR